MAVSELILQSGEQTVTQNGYGLVTDRRVVFFYKKGWFNPGSQEDLPLRHVTSVRLETERHPIWGIILLLAGLMGLTAGMDSGVFSLLLGLVFLALSALLLWGSPKVILNTAGGDHRWAVGLPWTKAEAETFVKGLRSQLFKTTDM